MYYVQYFSSTVVLQKYRTSSSNDANPTNFVTPLNIQHKFVKAVLYKISRHLVHMQELQYYINI
jgi:hypothetical protein